jgi:phage tail protein X
MLRLVIPKYHYLKMIFTFMPTQGDRYDLLALNYYGNSSLWWIIAAANPNLGLNTLILPEGQQIRIPGNFSQVVSEFSLINQLRS